MSTDDEYEEYEGLYEETAAYQPHRDERGSVSEDEEAYVRRMRATLLPHWPQEVLTEWLHRHCDDMAKYAFLDFKTLTFRRETWPVDRIPGAEAFDDEGFCDAFSNVEVRAEWPYDWLAIFMCKNGKWNTPIVLLDNPTGTLVFPYGRPLKSPFHLLEGHRRLSFLNGLRQRGKALPQHDVWLARKIG